MSIVTPSLNHGRFIGDTIESVRAQDYPYIEHLVQDGGSTDGTLSVLDRYDDCLSWVSESDASQSHAIMKGFRRAGGDILTWLNSDDLLLPGAVSAAVQSLRADPGLGLVYGDGYVTDLDDVSRRMVHLPDPNVWELANLNCYIFQPSCFFRRDVFWAVGGLNEKLRWVMDYDLFLRISMRHRTAHVASPWAVQRVYDECLTMSGGLPRYRELVSVVREHSGRRYPPAWAYYLAETVATNASRRLRSSTFPTARLEAAVDATGRRVATTFHQRKRPIQSDRWVGRRAKLWLLREAGDAIEIRGEVPEAFGDRRGLRLRVGVNGHPALSAPLMPGPFRLLCLTGLPAGNQGDPDASVVRLHLDADRSFTPARLGQGSDRRSLSWRLTSLSWVDASRVDLPDPVGWYEDGWVAPRAHLTVRRAGDLLVLRGEVPIGYPKIGGQQLIVRSSDRELARALLRPGPFDIRISQPGEGTLMGLELEADRWFVPEHEGIGLDRRRLSYLLRQLAWID